MSTQAAIVAWACFGLGVVVLLVGAYIGLALSAKRKTRSVSATDVSEKVNDARAKVTKLKETAVAGANKAASDKQAASDATSTAAEVHSVLGEIGGIVGSLPENLRFAGLLVLVGTVLIGVATVQFGGHSLF